MTYPLSERAPQAPVSRAWVSPFASSLVTLPLALCAFVYASFSSMACDSCESAASARFEATIAVGYDVLRIVLGLSLAVLLASWTLPWRERYAGTRWVLAALAPCLVVIGFVLFERLVDWPPSG
jgi:hypothetical protein